MNKIKKALQNIKETIELKQEPRYVITKNNLKISKNCHQNKNKIDKIKKILN